MKSRTFAAGLLTTALVCASQVSAQTPSAAPSDQPKAKARVHFDRGVALASEGKLEAAIAEFESAYELSPHYSVLFNLGQAQAACGHSLEALEAFRRYLAEGGSSVKPARRELVQGLIAFHEKRIGSVRFVAQPDGSEVTLDGHVLGTSPLSKPFEVTAGAHTATAKRAGRGDTSETFEVQPGGVTEIVLKPPVAGTSASQGLLLARCPVPDVELAVDGRSAGRTPSLGPAYAEAGERTIRFSRNGYVADERSVELSAAAPTEISCRLKRDPRAPTATLSVRSVPADAGVSVDGARFRSGPLPLGRHTVRIERAGYEPWSHLVTVETSKTAFVAVELVPTKAHADELRAREAQRQTWAVALTISGAVLVGAAVATYAWNSGRYDDWRKDRKAVDAELAKGPASPALLHRNAEVERHATSVQAADDAALFLGIAGGITLGASAGFWFAGSGEP